MPKVVRQMLLALLAGFVAPTGVATAVCLNSKTLVSGYPVPLAEEINSSAAIVIGKVIAERRVSDDPSHPEYFSATIYTVHVDKAEHRDCAGMRLARALRRGIREHGRFHASLLPLASPRRRQSGAQQSFHKGWLDNRRQPDLLGSVRKSMCVSPRAIEKKSRRPNGRIEASLIHSGFLSLLGLKSLLRKKI
jgi:hypothetical protein